MLSLVIFSHSLPCFLCAAKLGVRMLCYVPSYFASLSASPAVSLSLITSCVYLSTQFSSVPCCVLPHMTFCVIIIYCCVLGFCFCTFGSSPALLYIFVWVPVIKQPSRVYPLSLQSCILGLKSACHTVYPDKTHLCRRLRTFALLKLQLSNNCYSVCVVSIHTIIHCQFYVNLSFHVL